MEEQDNNLTNGSMPAHSNYDHGPSRIDSNLAIFVDFDSINVNRLEYWLDRFSLEGRICICRAYCDWTRFDRFDHKVVQKLMTLSIDLVQVTNYIDRGKNGVDIRLSVDAMEIAFTRKDIDKYVLIASDSDYISLVVKLREYNKYVHMVGNKGSTSPTLIGYCDEFNYLSDVETVAQAGSDSKEETIQEKTEAFLLLDKAIQQLELSRATPPYRDSSINDTMRRLNKSFDYRRMGYRSLGDFLREAQAMERITYTIKEDKNGNKGYVSPYKSSTRNNAVMRGKESDLFSENATQILMLFRAITEGGSSPRDSVAYSELIQYGGIYLKDVLSTPAELRTTVKEMISRHQLIEFYDADNPSHLLIRLSDSASQKAHALQQDDMPAWYWTMRYAKQMVASKIPTNLVHTVYCWYHTNATQDGDGNERTLQDCINLIVSKDYIRAARIRDHFELLIKARILELGDNQQIHVLVSNVQKVWNRLIEYVLSSMCKNNDNKRDPKALQDIILNVKDLSDSDREHITQAFAAISLETETAPVDALLP